MKDFLQSLDLTADGVFEDKNLIVVQQTGIDGSFLLQYLLAEFMDHFKDTTTTTTTTNSTTSSCHVILILSHNSLNHWISVCGKLGINLNTLIANGQLDLIDKHKDLYEILKSSFGEKSTENVEESSCSSPLTNGMIDLTKLFDQCKGYLDKFNNSISLTSSTGTCTSSMKEGKSSTIGKKLISSNTVENQNISSSSSLGLIKNKDSVQVEVKEIGNTSISSAGSQVMSGDEKVIVSQPQPAKVLLIVEDLSDILYENLNLRDNNHKMNEKSTINFLQNLLSLSSTGNYELSIATLVNSTTYTNSSTTTDSSRDFFSKIISDTLASISLQVSPLKTGSSQQINGLLKVKSSSKKLDSFTSRWIKNFHYKLEDRNIKCIPIT